MKCWVIDPNVVVSGLLNPSGPPARILDAMLDGRVRLAYDARIPAEYRDVLRRPRLNLKPAAVAALLAALRGQMLVNPRAIVTRAPDVDDLIVVACAIAASARTIVTGNLADYPDEILHGTRVFTPSQAAAGL